MEPKRVRDTYDSMRVKEMDMDFKAARQFSSPPTLSWIEKQSVVLSVSLGVLAGDMTLESVFFFLYRGVVVEEKRSEKETKKQEKRGGFLCYSVCEQRVGKWQRLYSHDRRAGFQDQSSLDGSDLKHSNTWD